MASLRACAADLTTRPSKVGGLGAGPLTEQVREPPAAVAAEATGLNIVREAGAGSQPEPPGLAQPLFRWCGVAGVGLTARDGGGRAVPAAGAPGAPAGRCPPGALGLRHLRGPSPEVTAEGARWAEEGRETCDLAGVCGPSSLARRGAWERPSGRAGS